MNEEKVSVAVVPITKENRTSLARLAITMHISGMVCPVCKHEYTSYEDIMERNPKCGIYHESVCTKCWDKYVELAKDFCDFIIVCDEGENDVCP